MGLFNTLKIDSAINLPQFNTDSKIVNWQTKDLVDDVCIFSDLHIDANGHLKVNTPEQVWVENDDKFFGGYFETVRTETKELTWYTGTLSFYNSYTHSEYEYSMDSLHDFKYGWYEYNVKIVDGIIADDIICVEHTAPVKLSVEESAAARQKAKENRAQFEKDQSEQRSMYPSAVETLIDTLDSLTKKPESFIMPEMSDYDAVLKEISESIKAYRNKHDMWYTPKHND
jgi:hypothetical protein